MDTIRAYQEILKENIEYDILRSRYPYDEEQVEEILALLTDTVCTSRKTIRHRR